MKRCRDTRSLEVIEDWEKVVGTLWHNKQTKAQLQCLINAALDEQDKITRHRCAEAVSGVVFDYSLDSIRTINLAHDAVMNSGENQRINNNPPALTTDRYPRTEGESK